MELDSREVGAVTIVRCKGRLVHGDDADSLRSTVKKLIHHDACVLLNLVGVSYFDSSGIGTLFGLHTSAVNAGDKLVITGASQRLLDVLHRTRLDTVLNVYASEEAAIKSLLSSRPA